MATRDGTGVAFVEYPVAFKGGREDLYGILVEPEESRDGVAVVLAHGAGVIPMAQRNRIWARLARCLAADGFPVLRFDWHGGGESTGYAREYHLDEPFVDDLLAAVRCLERHRPVSTLILVGTCFGARAAIAAGEHLPQLSAVVLLSTPVRGRRRQEAAANKFADTLTLGGYVRRAARFHVVRRMLNPMWRERYWRVVRVKAEHIKASLISPRATRDTSGSLPRLSWKFLDGLRKLPQRNVDTLLLYGADDDAYQDFRSVWRDEFREFAHGAGGRIEVEVVSGTLHGFTTLDIQEVALDRISGWIRANYPRFALNGRVLHPVDAPAGETT